MPQLSFSQTLSKSSQAFKVAGIGVLTVTVALLGFYIAAEIIYKAFGVLASFASPEYELQNKSVNYALAAWGTGLLVVVMGFTAFVLHKPRTKQLKSIITDLLMAIACFFTSIIAFILVLDILTTVVV